MFKNKTLNEIGERFFCERKEFKIKKKITILERFSMFFPGISLLGIFNIRKKIKNEIKRAEKESNISIPFNLNSNSITDSWLKKNTYIVLNLFFGTTLFLNYFVSIHSSSNFNLSIISGLALFTSIFLFLIFGFGFIINTEEDILEEFINRNNFKKNETLSESDMLLLTKDIPNSILKNMLLKKKFNFTYYDLWDLQNEIDIFDYSEEKTKKEISDKNKAECIIYTLSEKIKEKDIVNV